MKRSIFILLSGLVVVGALSISASVANSQVAPPGVNPTHFWTYKLVDPVFAPRNIFAKDQFYRAGVPLTVDSLTRWINWVRKNGSPVVPDTLLHYSWWNIQQKLTTPRAVRVTNQFGQYNVNVQNLEFMLVPAWKNQPQPTFPEANHYLCYRASGFPGPTVTFSLLDEWRQDFQRPRSMEYLCNPCQKEHAGSIYPPVDTLTHLALYPIEPFSDLFVPFIQDQFFQSTVSVRQTPLEYLLVPSEKIDVATPTRRGTWGKLKTLYR